MLGERLVGAGLLHPDKLAEARLHQELTGKDLVEALLTLKLVPERDLLRVLSQHHQLQYLTSEKIANLKLSDDLLERVKVRFAESLSVMPIRRNQDGTLWVLSVGPLSGQAEERLKRECDTRKVNVILARPASIRAAIRRHYYRDLDAFSSLEAHALPPIVTEPSLPTVSQSTRDGGRRDDPEVLDDLDDLTETPVTGQKDVTDPHFSVSRMELGETTQDSVVTRMMPLGYSVGDATDPGRRATESFRVVPGAEVLWPEGEITRRVKPEISAIHQEMERENQRLRVALSLLESMGQIYRLEDMVRELLVALLDLFPADGVAFTLDGEQDQPLLQETLRRDGGPAFQVPLALLGAVAGASKPLAIADAAKDARLAGEAALLARGARSLMIAPVRSSDEHSSGVLYVEAKDLSAFGPEAEELAQVVSRVAGVALDHVNLVLRQEQQARIRATHERFLSTRRALAASISSPPFDLRPRAVEGTFLHARPMLRPRAGEPPAQLFQRLEAHVDAVSTRIHAHGGLVESISRGEVGALFGGPESHEQHLENALAAALEIFALSGDGDGDGRTLPVAVGVATGPMLAGGAGLAGQLHYAVLGEPADLARTLAAFAPSLELYASELVERQAGPFHRWESLKAGVSFAGELRPAFKLLWR